MEQLIEKLKAVLDDILHIKASLVAEKGTVAAQGQKQNTTAQMQDSRAVSLDDREAAVSSIEDIVIYKTAAEEVAKQSNEGRIALENAKNVFEVYKKEELSKITARQEEVRKQEALYKRELEALVKAKDDVARDAANLKGKVLGELAQKV